MYLLIMEAVMLQQRFMVSYDCPQVWTLRYYRDNVLAETWHGRIFIQIYYAISPTIVKWFGKTEWFNRIFRNLLDNFIEKLKNNQ